ncbi:MAG: HEPN domain-containing protein [Chloroflexi bacterium]|nr:HEPN domain-containing protein [Chloroflexota bacterium]
MPRRTDSNNPADWLWFAASDLEALRVVCQHEVGYALCRSKLAEVLEKVLKAELIRTGWFLERTHDLQRLRDTLAARGSDLAVRVKPLCDTLAELYFTDRYPGFDLDDPDWPALRRQLEEVSSLLATVQERVAGSGT